MLNVSCSHNTSEKGTKQLPLRMPDGSKIESNRNLVRKISKSHFPATSSGKVFIPVHKLPVLDEFGLSKPSDHQGYQKPVRLLPSLSERESGSRKSLHQQEEQQNNQQQQQQKQQQQLERNAQQRNHQPKQVNGHGRIDDNNGNLGVKSILKKPANESMQEVDTSSKKAKRRKRKQREDELKIIPKEVQAVAGGLPPSFPQYRIKKFTEEYQLKKKRQREEGEDSDGADPKKKRRSFVPGLNPRKREKASNLFTDSTLQDLEDLHPFLVSNLEQNFEIKNLTKIQTIAMPMLLKTRFS